MDFHEDVMAWKSSPRYWLFVREAHCNTFKCFKLPLYCEIITRYNLVSHIQSDKTIHFTTFQCSGKSEQSDQPNYTAI